MTRSQINLKDEAAYKTLQHIAAPSTMTMAASCARNRRRSR